MTYIVTLDPAETIEDRVELSLNTGSIAVDHAGINWGTAQIEAYLAAQQQYGSAPVSFRVPNRTVEIPLFLGAGHQATHAEEVAAQEEARKQLQQKVALFQREAGVLKRQREGGEATYLDIVSASLTVPDKYGETAGVEPEVVLILECLPDFYGLPVELTEASGEGQIVTVLQQSGKDAVVGGDHPARGWVALSNPSESDQRGLLWGVRCEHYDPAPTAALFFDAKDLTPINGAAKEAHTGTYSGEWVKLAEPVPSTWHPFLTTDLVATKAQATHTGSYRVWARSRALSPALTQLRLAWSLDDATVPQYNPAVYVGRTEGLWPHSKAEVMALLDLGTVRLEGTPVGTHWWRGIVQAFAEEGSASWVAIDRIWLQPLAECAGELTVAPLVLDPLVPRPSPRKAATAANSEGALPAWTNLTGNPTVTVAPTRETSEGPFGESTDKKYSRGESLTLLFTDFGFALPEGAIIEEITMNGVAYGSGPAYLGYLLFAGNIAKGSWMGNTLAVGTGTPYGAPQYEGYPLWGGHSEKAGAEWVAWTPAAINSGFGVAAYAVTQALIPEGKSWKEGPSATVTLEPPTVTIAYTLSGHADAVLYAKREAQIRTEGSYREDTESTGYVKISEQTGDLLRLPPSGLEGRPVELFIKPTRGALRVEADAGIDAIKATVGYRPALIGRA